MEEEKISFTVTDENGQEVECDVLFVFQAEENKKHYMVYTDNTVDEEGNLKIYASTFDPTAEEIILGEIEDDSEWDLVDKNIQQKMEEMMQHGCEGCEGCGSEGCHDDHCGCNHN